MSIQVMRHNVRRHLALAWITLHRADNQLQVLLPREARTQP